MITGLVPRFTGGRLSGDVLLDGDSIVAPPPRERVDRIGYVGQDPLAGFVTDTVEEELAYGMEQLGLAAATMRRRVEETLDLLGIADLRSRDLRTLSGGQQQRVAIGWVLAMHPRLLVLDEPTSALDPTAAEDVLATLTRLVHDAGLSVLLAEHRLERVLPFADRVALLTGDGGLLVGAPARCCRTRRSCRPSSSWVARPAGSRCRSRSATRAGVLVTSHLPAPPDPARRQRRGGRARGERRSVAHGRVVARARRRAEPAAGSVTALMGRNGSGKSTLLWTLQGSGRRRDGEVAVDDAGSAVDPATVDAAQRRALVGLVPQTAADLLYLETVDEECAAADEGAGAAAGSCRALLDGLVPGLPGDQHPRDLSEGQRLALALAIVLTARPRHRAARRADARARLPRQAAPRRAPARPGRPRATRCWSRPTTSSSWRRSPTTSWCWPRARSCPRGPYAAWSPSRPPSPRRSPRSSGRRGCAWTSSPCGGAS